MQRSVFGAILFVSLMGAATANAAVNLVEKNDWKLDIYGFAEIDMNQDSTRSFTEVIGNGAVARSGTTNGDNGRTQDSIRNSRLGFVINAPEQDGWKTKGVLEFDLLGYDPGPSNVTQPTNSEGSFSQNPTLRMRHGYFNTENDGLQFYAGQTWSLFGWQPYYQPALLSVAPESGEMYQRTAQFGSIKTYGMGDSSRLQIGASVERASQKDSNMPNIDVGVRYAYDGLKTATASSYGDYKLDSLSVGVSGTFRQFESFQPGSTTSNYSKQNASAVAVDALIPIIPNSDAKSPGNSLSLAAEYTSGTGYADELSSWSGGLAGATSSATTTAYTGTNLDAGFGLFDANNNLDLIQLQTFNASLQYVLPFEKKQMINVGVSQVSSNLNTLTITGGQNLTSTGVNGVYDKVSNQFINYWVDMSGQIRLGAEYSNQTTHYVGDGMTTSNNRVQITALYRF